MNILALGDPHGKLPKNLHAIIKKRNIELIICIGDIARITNLYGQRGHIDKSGGDKIMEKLNSFNIPILMLKGNMYMNPEGKKRFAKLLKSNENIIYKRTGKVNVKGRNFILFDMIWESWSHKGDRLTSFVKKMIKSNKRREKKLNNLLKLYPSSILVSHAPPMGYLDRIPFGKHVGSKVLLKAIQKYKPKLVLCGHIHEDPGKAKIGKTTIYNLGSSGSYKILKV